MSVAEAPPKPEHALVPHSGPDLARQPANTQNADLLRAPDLPDSSLSSRRVARGRRPRSKRSIVLCLALLTFLVIAAATYALVGPLRSSASMGAGKRLQLVGSLISSSTVGAMQLRVGTVGGQVVTVSVMGKKFASADGYPLARSSFRLGDSVGMTAGAELVDRSQSRVSLHGIVAISPDPDGNVMAVQVTPTRTILVDIDSKTQINGHLPNVRSRMSVEEADQVQIVGILDTTLDEVTQTVAINRIALDGSSGLQ